jgi:histidinol-phosphatase
MTPGAAAQVALEAAQAAGEIIDRYYRRGVDVTLKGDGSPVTRADTEAEALIRSRLLDAFPGDGFLGEESERLGSRNGRTWIVDPIDGTRSFVRGYPFFSTQIALDETGELVLGVSSAPCFGELAFAERGRGAWLNGERLAVSDVSDFASASVSIGNVATLTRDRRWAGLGRIVARVARFRGYGDFYHYHLLAAGKIDAVLESDVNIYDIAALAVLVREAGGRVTDLDGGPVTFETTTILATNGALHEPVLQMLNAVD